MSKCLISISRPQSGDGRKYISLSLVDDASRVQFVEVEFSLEDFMEALTGLSNVEGKASFCGLELIGCTAEHQETMVDVPKGLDRKNDAAITEALRPYEVEGWKARRDDLFNGHRGNYVRQRVSFTRHVRADGTPVL